MTDQAANAVTTDLRPIVVSSPTLRSGTTLLQRLLCSSPDCLIYGENVAQDLEMLLMLHHNRRVMYGHNRDRFTSTRELVASGETNNWILDMMPDLSGYLRAMAHACVAGLEYCRDDAAMLGRYRW